ncbi:MAG: alcohol dehydrogenase catalytic domain-containing protein [Acidobacteria bacterium]|nr:alcohol dehydrogenase catalytic domain-containing protein [Acidobacteriota bacterium]MCB9397950.1 alcohol dehydrogenase catalytic domain-containing protein [Acidobacteriota bacterium]
MNALVFDTQRGWETSKGLEKVQTDAPRLEETNDPEDALAVIVKPLFSGFCGSDRGIWYRSAFKDMIHQSLAREDKAKRITGHEFIGEIVEMGSLVRKHFGLREGQHVAAESHIICENCYQCQTGQSHVCTNEKILGISIDGCFAQYLKIPAKILWPTNTDKIDLRVASIQEPFGNAVHLCTQADLRGKTVIVLGCGTIGLFSILIAREWGAFKIIGIDPNPRQRAMAEACGADEVLDLPKVDGSAHAINHDFVQQIRSSLPHQGADVVLEVAGLNSSVNYALALARRGGMVMLFGLKGGVFQIPDFEKIIMNGLEIKAVVGRQVFQTWHHTRALLENTRNGIQDKVLRVILNNGVGTVIPFDGFQADAFEQSMLAHPKLTLQFS